MIRVAVAAAVFAVVVLITPGAPGERGGAVVAATAPRSPGAQAGTSSGRGGVERVGSPAAGGATPATRSLGAPASDIQGPQPRADASKEVTTAEAGYSWAPGTAPAGSRRAFQSGRSDHRHRLSRSPLMEGRNGGNPGSAPTADPELYQGHNVRWWARRAVQARKDANARGDTIRRLKRRWHPTVSYAIRLAASVYGVPEQQLRAVAACESTFNPYATNGRYRGLFQLGWVPFRRFSPFDPVANALSAAATVRNDGGWRQWECKP